MSMLCRMLLETGVADIVENASLRLRQSAVHQAYFTNVYIYFSEN